MSDIKIQKDTEDAIKLLLKLCEVIMHRYEIEDGARKLINGETLESYDNTIVNTSKIMFGFLENCENDFGGGYIDLGSSKALRLISESEVTDFNLQTLFLGYQTIVNKLVLMDAARTGQEHLAEFGSICSQFSKTRAA